MWGGIRSGIALRPFLLELNSITIPALMTIPKANNAIDPEGRPSAEQEERLNRQAKRMIEQVNSKFSLKLKVIDTYIHQGRLTIIILPL